MCNFYPVSLFLLFCSFNFLSAELLHSVRVGTASSAVSFIATAAAAAVAFVAENDVVLMLLLLIVARTVVVAVEDTMMVSKR